MREYQIRLYDISRQRYKELKAIYQQYPEYKFKADKLLGLQGKELSDMPKGNELSNPTERQAERREYYLKRMRIIESSIMNACENDERLYRAIFQNLVYSTGYEKIRKKTRYLSEKEFYFTRRKALNNLDLSLVELGNNSDL